MRYVIDNRERARGSFPPGELSEEEFFAQFDASEAAYLPFGVGAQVNCVRA